MTTAETNAFNAWHAEHFPRIVWDEPVEPKGNRLGTLAAIVAVGFTLLALAAPFLA